LGKTSRRLQSHGVSPTFTLRYLTHCSCSIPAWLNGFQIIVPAYSGLVREGGIVLGNPKGETRKRYLRVVLTPSHNKNGTIG
jgi:hypothetical protein